MTALGELVVGGAGDDLGAQASDGGVVEDRAECAGRKDVGFDVVDGLGSDHGGAQFVGEALRARRVVVGHHEDGACFAEMAGERPADIAASLQGDDATLERGCAPPVLGRRDQAGHDSARGPG